ncbi:AraC family transcriptional regulator [Photobacterium sanctipauli]|uniref:AraC family transcriptional regulator n=2 Tax=Photobacterium sanctipauli TaxID=1342794 RepID=A0A2T3NZY0_9GAMM|nr:helix-turn-helix transcriptional regulator [Photobacterium sanctipauli]PSW21825.1 AraC family transcriptional regulator [Photobacterium sanctipauli]
MINAPLLLNENIDSSGVSLRSMWEIQGDSNYNVLWPQDRKLPLIPNAIVAICTFQGSGTVRMKNGKQITVNAPSVVFLDSMMIKSYSTNGVVWNLNWFEFVTHGVINIPMEYQIPIHLDDYKSTLSDIKHLIKGKESHLKAANAGFSFVVYKWLTLADDIDSVSSQEKVVMNVVSMMSSRIGENVQIREFAQAVGYSEQYLRKIFLKQLGCTPKQYYLQLKLDASHMMLKRNGASVKQVAYDLGFSDSFHFSRAFKKQFYYSPSEVEKQS